MPEKLPVLQLAEALHIVISTTDNGELLKRCKNMALEVKQILDAVWPHDQDAGLELLLFAELKIDGPVVQAENYRRSSSELLEALKHEK